MNENNLYNTQAEQTILGAIFLDANVIDQIQDLSSEVFYVESHKIIFDTIINLHKEDIAIDIVTLSNKLRKNNLLEEVGGVSYMTSLATIVPTTQNIRYYVKIVEELAYRRLGVKASYKLIEDIRNGEDINTCLNKFEKSTQIKEEITKDNTLSNIMQKIFEMLDSGEKVEKLRTGIPIIDKYTNGIERGELVTIGAKSGVGKSALSLKIGIEAFLKGKKVLVISREMSSEQVAQRIILSYTGITKEKYESRDFNDEDWLKIVNTIQMFSSENFKIDDKISTIQGIKKELRNFKPDVLIVDYVQLLTPNNAKDTRERQVAELSRELKSITLDYNVVVYQLTQLADKGLGNYKPHGESYTRESRAIHQDSNIVIYIHQVSEEKELEIAYKNTVFRDRGSFEDMKTSLENYKKNGARFVELIVDKNRNGEVGSNYYWFKGSDLGYYPIV